ncbi:MULTISPECIES: TRAP transporter substrate-binding protein DctP [unclassified Leisingera]|uniref:TRAP transporter substrate-binding protein DctP n=1 Tax=unclassified Leisingera TaxID=2614906 RepID=UPI00030940C2|nr:MULTISPECIES: TRAP transporter substrate-binding protein DctP [unclassified Leisingera]
MKWWKAEPRKLAASAIAAAVAATIGLAASGARADTWKFAFEEAIDEVQGKFAQRLKAEIEQNSDHTLQLFPYGTLGESDDVMEQGQAGILEFIIQSPGFTGALIPEAQVFFVPYLLPNSPEHLANFFRDSVAINETFKGIYAEQGLELLQMFPTGEVVMTTKSEVHSPADLNEVKFRVMTNPLLVEAYKAFGAVPTPLPWGEVYGGLQTNIVQGQENPTSFVWSTKLYEVTDVITFTGHSNFTTAFMANKEFFDELSEADKEVVRNAVSAAFEYIVAYQKGLEEESLKKILEAKPDMQVVVLSEEERAPFRTAAKAVEAKFVEMTGDRGAAILEQMKADISAAMQ